MVYSHHHADHQGASSLFGGDIVPIGHEETQRLLLRDDDPARPVPDGTFSDSYTVEVGGERVELAWHGPNHSADNIYIHFPDHADADPRCTYSQPWLIHHRSLGGRHRRGGVPSTSSSGTTSPRSNSPPRRVDRGCQLSDAFGPVMGFSMGIGC